MLTRDERPHLRVGLEAVADLHLRDALLDLRDEGVGDVTDRDEHRDGHAALARRAVAGGDGCVGSHVEVGVGQHDHVVLRAAERLAPLVMCGRRLVDVLGDRRRADERDRSDVRMLQERIHSDLVAVHDVEDSGGHAGFGEQLRGQHRR